MRIMLATAGDSPWSRTLAEEFQMLACAGRSRVHELETAPEKADAVLFVDAHQFPPDWVEWKLLRHEIVRAHPDKSLVYDERDVPRDLLPGIYVAMPRRRFDARRHRAFGYYRLTANTRPVRETAPDLLFSFQGRRAGPVRRHVLELTDARAVVVDSSGRDFFGPESMVLAEARKRYVDLVARSKFVLCPRGAGTSSIRLFETLAAGRVPVIISDDWVPPAGIDWHACSVRVPERDVSSIGQLLRAVEESWADMAAAAAGVYDDWFSPEAWFDRAGELCREIVESGEVGVARQWTRPAAWIAAVRRFGMRARG